MPNITDHPQIGDFQRPTEIPVAPTAATVSSVKPTPAPAPTGDTAKNLEATEARLATEAAAAEAELKPLQVYENALKEIGLTREEAAAIFDSYLEKGYYEREFTISKRINGKFRTRSRADTQRLIDYIEATQPKFANTQNEITYRFLLAGSLVQIGKTVFTFPDRKSTREVADKLYEERLAYLDNVGDAFFRLLCDALQKFDSLVMVALKEGAVEGF